MIASLAMPLPLVLGLLGQVSPSPEKPEAAADRLEFMKKSVMIYELQSTEPPAGVFRLEREPVFRLINPVSGIKDGAIFVWTEDDRPMAAVQVFVLPSGVWLHEFSSLSPSRFAARMSGSTAWAPSKPGVEFAPVPGAPRPADSPGQRLRQMHAMAQRFAATDHFQSKTWQTLRLLSKPLARYGKPDSPIADGALFSFVLATDPEVFLFLEERPGAEGPEWQYAFAPMTAYAVNGMLDGKIVWSLPLRPDPKDPSLPFCNRVYRPGD